MVGLRSSNEPLRNHSMKSISTNQYDHIAHEYHQSTLERDDREYVLDPSIEYYLYAHNLVNKRVLDLGCGAGHYARLVARKGAKVLAIDSSSEEIKIAQDIERAERLGIEYRVLDARNMPKLGEFDVVLALFLLHYCKDKQELQRMCEGIYQNIKPGGYFLCFNNNPLHPVQDCMENYDYSIAGPQPLKEGDILTVSLKLKDGSVFSFEHYYWSKETYQEALIIAGFKAKNIHWRSLVVSESGKRRFPGGFWDEYLANSNPIALECKK